MPRNDEFRPIPDWEDYTISRNGEVMSSFGFPLKIRRGKVTLHCRGRKRVASVADLAAETWPVDITPPQETVPEKKPESMTIPTVTASPPRESLEEFLTEMIFDRSDREPETPNALLRANKTIEALKAELERVNAKCVKLERQRDTLAAGRLLEAMR